MQQYPQRGTVGRLFQDSISLISIYVIIANILQQFNFFHANVPPHIEPSKLICIENQFTGFYMRGNIGMKKVKVWVFCNNSRLFQQAYFNIQLQPEMFFKDVAVNLPSLNLIEHYPNKRLISSKRQLSDNLNSASPGPTLC